MNKDQCCRILQVSENISKDELKTKYKRLVLKYHPDRNKEANANEKFIQIKNAYEELVKILEQPGRVSHPGFRVGTFVTLNQDGGYSASTPSWTFTFTSR